MKRSAEALATLCFACCLLIKHPFSTVCCRSIWCRKIADFSFAVTLSRGAVDTPVSRLLQTHHFSNSNNRKSWTMHPQLIPEKHPQCGKYMEALVQCRKDNPVRKYWGACNDITFALTKCLAVEKKEFRAPRQEKFQKQWQEKRAADQARLAELDALAEQKRAQKAQAEAAQQQQPGGSQHSGEPPVQQSTSQPTTVASSIAERGHLSRSSCTTGSSTG